MLGKANKYNCNIINLRRVMECFQLAISNYLLYITMLKIINNVMYVII